MTSSDDDSVTSREASGGSRRAHTTALFVLGSCGESPRVTVRLDGELTIGRGRPPEGAVHDQCAKVISLPDRLLSRQHLRIQTRAGGYEVEDLGSTNGSMVDGQPVDKPRSLSDGSIVLFGNHAGVFRRASAAALAALEEERAQPFGPVATTSPSMALTLAKLRRLAVTDAELLFVGETGVGKEVYSRAVHEASGRKGPFLAINCAAIPAELVESELYGYARGAHSTATQPKAGLIEQADGGTLLLDEIGDMRPALQGKIFRFLQDRLLFPLGATAPRPIDVRVLAATSKLGDAVRPDLRARLGSDPIELPPLRERVEDIAALAAHFGGAALRGLEPAAFRALHLYAWPLNVRELASAITRAIAAGAPVALEHLPKAVAAALQQGPPIAARRRYRAAPSKEELETLMRDQQGNVAAVAKALDRKWSVVKKWLQRYKLRADQFRD
jgi:sigma-54 dependent transcriptional regulator, acetoin dehydrogenase operon transcriptional activator AcoR